MEAKNQDTQIQSAFHLTLHTSFPMLINSVHLKNTLMTDLPGKIKLRVFIFRER